MTGDNTGARLPLMALESRSDDNNRRLRGSFVDEGSPARSEASPVAGAAIRSRQESSTLQGWMAAEPTGGEVERGYGGYAPADLYNINAAPHDTSSGGADLYTGISRKYMELGLDYAYKIFARSLVSAIEEDVRREYADRHMTPDVLEKWKFVFTTWQSAWERGQTRLLEQAIALSLDGLPNGGEQKGEQVGAPERRPQPPLPPPPYPDSLTAREVEVLCWLTTGLSNGEVAERLCLSRRTIHAHLRSIYGKIGVNSRAGATRYAIEHNLVG